MVYGSEDKSQCREMGFCPVSDTHLVIWPQVQHRTILGLVSPICIVRRNPDIYFKDFPPFSDCFVSYINKWNSLDWIVAKGKEKDQVNWQCLFSVIPELLYLVVAEGWWEEAHRNTICFINSFVLRLMFYSGH